MDEGPRFFSVEEANGLVPTLVLEFGRVARARAELGPVIEALGGAEPASEILHSDADPPPGGEAAAARLHALADEITSAVERLNGLGCLVKDLERGLVDFYAMQDGEPVYLCWQFGEPAVAHWHGLEEGFAGRREIEGLTVEPPAFPN
ncbi:MAG TPA: DUF2203 domain-containing protein [Anaeromyxobacter sp.]|nr:DUF2203 domain-containing protein [Anaeromyxobacter sp.]